MQFRKKSTICAVLENFQLNCKTDITVGDYGVRKIQGLNVAALNSGRSLTGHVPLPITIKLENNSSCLFIKGDRKDIKLM